MTVNELVDLQRFIADPSIEEEVAVERVLKTFQVSHRDALFRVRMSRGLISQEPAQLQGKPFAEHSPKALFKARLAKKERLEKERWNSESQVELARKLEEGEAELERLSKRLSDLKHRIRVKQPSGGVIDSARGA